MSWDDERPPSNRSEAALRIDARRLTGGRVGRPAGSVPNRREVDLELLRRISGLGCTERECAIALGMTRDTFVSILNRRPEVRAAFEDGQHMGRTTLRRLQWQRATQGSDQMLIWLGKQLLDQRDKADIDVVGETVHRVISEQPLTEEEWLAKFAPPTIDGDAEEVVDEELEATREADARRLAGLEEC